MTRNRTIAPSTLLIVLVAASLISCAKKSKPAVKAPVETPAETTSRPATTDTTPDVVEDEQDLPAQDASASLENVIYFEFDASSLSASAREALNENAEWLGQDPARTLTIEGHTDEVGTTEYNLALGERRARAAQDYLLRLGVEADRVNVLTYGEEKPAASGDDAANRRAMFVATRP